MIKIILIFTFVIVNLSQLSLAKIASVIGNPITNEIYFEVNKNTRNYPASLTKIMTLYIVFDELNKNNLKLKTELKMKSEDYWKNTHKALTKISERLVKMANKVGNLK